MCTFNKLTTVACAHQYRDLGSIYSKCAWLQSQSVFSVYVGSQDKTLPKYISLPNSEMGCI